MHQWWKNERTPGARDPAHPLSATKLPTCCSLTRWRAPLDEGAQGALVRAKSRIVKAAARAGGSTQQAPRRATPCACNTARAERILRLEPLDLFTGVARSAWVVTVEMSYPYTPTSSGAATKSAQHIDSWRVHHLNNCSDPQSNQQLIPSLSTAAQAFLQRAFQASFWSARRKAWLGRRLLNRLESFLEARAARRRAAFRALPCCLGSLDCAVRSCSQLWIGRAVECCRSW
jgi:hypothetical protein